MSPKINQEAYAAVYISLPWHEKVLAIPEADRLAAFGLYVATLALCQSYRNDGHVPAAQLVAVFPCPEAERKRLTQALIDVRLFDEVPGGIQVHDFLDHNNSRAEIESAHVRMSEGGRKGGVNSGKARGSQPSKPTLEGVTEKSSAEIAVKRSEEPCRAEARSAAGGKAPTPVPCPKCDGTGAVNGSECSECWGTQVVAGVR